MRTGHLGGSFDPVHAGHLALAHAAREGAKLDRVSLVVAGMPPHKPDRELAPVRHRVAMARLAVEGIPWLDVDDRETRREGPSYTLDTVRSLAAERPGDELFWIVGGDTAPEISTWREVDALFELVGFVIAVRPGHDPERGLETLARRLGPERFARMRSIVVPMPPAEVSATEIRGRVRKGGSIAGMVPEAVERYVLRNGLYA